jgi:dienelactone hydrolase
VGVTTRATIKAEVVDFRSGIDGSEQRAGLCGPADAPAGALLPLLVELVPGSISNLEKTLEAGQQHLELVGAPAVWLRPGGRGPGTVFQGYGEVDVLEAIAAAAGRYPIDPRRISLYGTSMGGAGTWYLATHHPDRFAAVAPFCGYNDYRLWRRPGGMTFPLHPWEEPSWRARGAIFQLENLRHAGIWIVHGAWDRAVGGGVDVAHARNSAARLDALGIPYRYTELPGVGHGAYGAALRTSLFGDVLRWLVAQRRPDAPARLTLASSELRHPGGDWIALRQLSAYGGPPARVDAEASPEEVAVRTEQVRHLVVGPAPLATASTRLRIDGTLVPGADARARTGLRRRGEGESWEPAEEAPPAGEKRPGVCGPFGDLFGRGTVLVTGTTGSAEERFFLDWCARDAAQFFRTWNGGVHRGGIAGDNWVDLPVMTDAAYLASGDATRNVLAFGTPTTNALLAAHAGALGLELGAGTIRLRGREWRGERVSLIAVLPHPEGGDRYLAVHGGVTPDAITSGAHLHWQLLPDYLVYDGDRVLEWGHFDNEWRPPPPVRPGGPDSGVVLRAA